ncbi:MAG: 16S rRNA (uracil(1498)-N(3))-methyltransferase [Clostridiales bacterium]|nr:16S rRNA (uracil(1498)-N(3))-methyltransferase [Clostridiales bacterium]
MRFYLPSINKSRPELTGDAHTHAAYARRIRVGDNVTVFDGIGHDYECKVTEIKKDKTLLQILDAKENVGESTISVTLYLSVIKQDRFELAVQKATELGVKKIVPVYSAFTQRNFNLNYDRLNKIAISACEQCRRSVVPIIEQAVDFDELLNRAKNSYMIFPWEHESNGTMREVLSGNNSADISVFIGPEGGITESETSKLVALGAKSVTLGKRILRAETAAIAALSVIYYEMGEWHI